MANKFPLHPTIEKLTKGENSPLNLRRLRGFLGKGSADGRSRIYSDLSLAHFIDIDEKYIHHVESPANSDDHHTPADIWLDAQTPLSLSDLFTISLLGVWDGPYIKPDPRPRPTGSNSIELATVPVVRGSAVGPIIEPDPKPRQTTTTTQGPSGRPVRGIHIGPHIEDDKPPRPPSPRLKRGRS